MSREVDRKLLARLEEMMPLITRSFRILDPRGLEGTDLTLNQFLVLSTLSRKERFFMGELAAELGTSSGNMTSVIDRLVRSGLVIRDRSERDRRMVEVKLSAKGEALSERVRRATEAGMLRLMRRIPDEKKLAFFDTLSLMLESGPNNRRIRLGPLQVLGAKR